MHLSLRTTRNTWAQGGPWSGEYIYVSAKWRVESGEQWLESEKLTIW